MKKYILFLVIYCLPVCGFSQPCFISFRYDANGNRIKRENNCQGQPLQKTVNSGLNVSTTDSLSQVADGFIIYPNPVLNTAFVKVDDIALKSACSVTVMDVNGKVIKNQTITSTLTEVEISNLPNGVYFFILKRGNVANAKRLVKLEN